MIERIPGIPRLLCWSDSRDYVETQTWQYLAAAGVGLKRLCLLEMLLARTIEIKQLLRGKLDLLTKSSDTI
jgi:pimeloyl-CoA synthetase